MAVYELLESNHPSLSVPVTEVTDSQEGREQIQQDLVDTMIAKSGVGLSANQIGIGARVFTMYADVKEKDIDALLNMKPTKFYETKTDATLNNIPQFGPSMAADATSYDVDKINAELGITNTAIGSAIKRGWELAMRGDLGSKEYLKLIKMHYLN